MILAPRRAALAALVLTLVTGPAAPARAFWNPFKKLEAFVFELDAMNKGATVKERWNNLVNAGGAAAPRAPAASVDAPSALVGAAEGEGLPDIRGVFGSMVKAAARLPTPDARHQALTRAVNAWVGALGRALEVESPEAVEALWSESQEVFAVDPPGVEARIRALTRTHPGALARELQRRARRRVRVAEHFRR